MSGRTITGSYSTGVTLTNSADSPVIITSGASIANAPGAALQSALPFYWTIDNSGIVQATASPNGVGIALAGGAAVTNGQSGRIAGYAVGVSIAGAGTVINQGSIAATQTTGNGYGYSGGFTALSAGVIMGGGLVNNAASGKIASYLEGIAIGAGGSVVNAGSISASSTKYGFGIVLPGGGSISNAATGLITAGRDAVITFGTITSTVTNDGIIAATKKIGVDLAHGGFVSNTGTITGGYDAVATGGATPSTVTNSGILNGTYSYGVILNSGGYLSNAATGTITGVYSGAKLSGAESSVVNLGSISSSQTIAGSKFDPAGVDLVAGGTVTNGVSGSIRATWKGVEIGTTTAFTAGTLLNQGFVYAYGRITESPSGTIISAGAAVWIHGVANISNAATGTIAGGPFGVVLYADAQVTNRGSIHGTDFAIFEKYVGDSVRLINYPGAVLSGFVEGSNTAGAASGILELASGTSTGTIAGFGSKYVGFSNITIDASAAWSFGGTVTSAQHLAFNGTNASLALANPRGMSGTITSFAPTDTLALTGITDVTSVTLGANNVLTVTESIGPSFTLQFDPAQDFSGEPFTFTTAGGATSLTVACFAAGTRILAERGLLPVQALRPGMRVRTLFDGGVDILWTGHRHIDCRRHTRPEQVWPVCVRAGAFGPGQPTDDVYLSPDHAVYVNAVLIPIRCLINGTTVCQVQQDEVAYFHIELAKHDVLFAQGLPVESYLDTGDRGNFANGGATVRLSPDLLTRSADASAIWDARGCARLVITGPELVLARGLVNDRAAGARARGQDQACDGEDPGFGCDTEGRNSQIAA